MIRKNKFHWDMDPSSLLDVMREAQLRVLESDTKPAVGGFRAICTGCGEVMSKATPIGSEVLCEVCRQQSLHLAGSPHPATPRSQRQFDGEALDW